MKGFEKIQSNVEALQIFVKETKSERKVFIKGEHLIPGVTYHAPFSEFSTKLSISTLKKIALQKGTFFRDEIERSESPDYIRSGMAFFLNEFQISLQGKKILDFGSGSGAFSVNLSKFGADQIIGAEVDEKLIDIAKAVIKDFEITNVQYHKIKFIDGDYKLPFKKGEFDIVWPHSVMEHVHPLQRDFVLKELWRVLKNDGILIIDGTPNRWWLKETHTSNLYLLNYLPLKLAAFFARKFSDRVPENQSIETLLERGFRGASYWQIKRALPNSFCQNNYRRKNDLRVWMKIWKRKNDSKTKTFLKETYGKSMALIDPLLKLFQIPQSALLPWHYLVFQKKT